MIGPFTRVVTEQNAGAVARLTHDQRRRARLLVTLEDGRDAHIVLARGTVLRDGDVLASEAGELVVIRAAAESLSIATANDPHLLARAAYHLGNRHVALRIEPRRLSYLHDHVLDAMCRGLGLDVVEERGPFEPEAGGYGHVHGHAHE